MSTTSARGDIWNEDETRAIINAWGDRKILDKLEECHRNSSIYSDIAEELEKQGFPGRSWKQCRTKCKHLKTQYKKFKDGLGKSGNSRKKAPKFYDLLDSFLGDRPEAVGLESGIDTGKSDEPTETFEPVTLTVDDSDKTSANKGKNVVDKLTARYSKGEMILKECAHCGYEEEVFSAGVHETAGGSLKVYSEDDEFHCPRCDLDDRIGMGAEGQNIDVDTKERQPEIQDKPGSDRSASVKPPAKKKKKTEAVDRAVASFINFQKEADEKFLKHLQEQSERDLNMRKEEMKANRESTKAVATAIGTAFANALSGLTQQPSASQITYKIPVPPPSTMPYNAFSNIYGDQVQESNGNTYFEL